MNGLDLSTPPRGNGRKLLKPFERTTLSGFDVNFETGTMGAEAHVEIYRPRNGKIVCTVNISVDQNRLAASIRNMQDAPAGVVWIRVTQRNNLADMEVIMGHQAPPNKESFKTLALIKMKDIESDKNDSDSDDEKDISFQIFVKLFSGKSTTYTVTSETLVKELMLEIQRRHQIPPDQQRLLYAGHQLEPQRSLGSYHIRSEATINMVARLRGG